MAYINVLFSSSDSLTDDVQDATISPYCFSGHVRCFVLAVSPVQLSSLVHPGVDKIGKTALMFWRNFTPTHIALSLIADEPSAWWHGF